MLGFEAIMNITEHSFPLPDVETQKLDQIQEEIRSGRPNSVASPGNSGTLWTLLGVLGASALVTWLWLRARET
jgi:hypothetical protein